MGRGDLRPPPVPDAGLGEGRFASPSARRHALGLLETDPYAAGVPRPRPTLRRPAPPVPTVVTRPLLLWTAAALLAGCAGAPRSLTTADVRTRLPALEARAEAAPQDADALRELGRAYARLSDYARAEEVLARARRLDPRDDGLLYSLGLLDEAQGRPAQAIERYAAVQGGPPYGPLAAGRRARLERQAERADIDALLDADAFRPLGDDVVAVFPLAFRGAAARRPLARGLAALLADDLAALGLRVVGAGRVGATLDALGLGPDDVDADRARRLGRLLQADHVVVGALDATGDSLRADAALWEWTATPAPDVAEAAAALDGLFEVEAALVAAFAERLGRTPPRPQQTRDGAAFLLFSRGLVEEDAGRFSEATTLYAEAARLDPGFRLAAERAASARGLASSSGTVSSAFAALDGLASPAASSRLLGQRLAHVTERLGVHAAVGDERDPAAEVPLAPPSSPLPPPPDPPSGQRAP